MKQIKIALADDHILLRNALAMLISKFDNCKVICQADTGTQLLQKIKEDNVPDVVIISIAVTEMNCYDTVQHLQTHYPDIHALILTGSDSEIAMIRMLQAGAKGFLKKNVQPDQLHTAITTVAAIGYYYSDHAVGRLLNLFRNGADGIRDIEKQILTDKEYRFLKLVCSDLTYKEIAREMGINPRNVDSIRDVLFQKLDVRSRVGMAMLAVRHGIIAM